jgi:hypothetical protein
MNCFYCVGITVRTVPKSNRKIVERGKIAANIHDHSLSWLGTDTSIKKIEKN